MALFYSVLAIMSLNHARANSSWNALPAPAPQNKSAQDLSPEPRPSLTKISPQFDSLYRISDSLYIENLNGQSDILSRVILLRPKVGDASPVLPFAVPKLGLGWLRFRYFKAEKYYADFLLQEHGESIVIDTLLSN